MFNLSFIFITLSLYLDSYELIKHNKKKTNALMFNNFQLFLSLQRKIKKIVIRSITMIPLSTLQRPQKYFSTKVAPQSKNRISLHLLCASFALLYRPSNASSAATIEEIAQNSWDYLSQTSPWNLVQAGTDSSIEGQVQIAGYAPAFSSVEESSWMTIIDLIQSCQLQLDPLPSLESSFNDASDTFFNELEAQEASGEDVRVRAAANLRTAIDTYRESCFDILSKYDTEMQRRKENEQKALESIQVTSVANENAAQNQKNLVQISTSSSSNMAYQFAQQDSQQQETEEVAEESTPSTTTSDAQQTDASQESTTESAPEAQQETSKTTEAAVSTAKETPSTEQATTTKQEKPQEEKTLKEPQAEQTKTESATSTSTEASSSEQQTEATTTTEDQQKQQNPSSTVQKIDQSQPLGKLVYELDLLKSLSDGELISVTYGGGDQFI